MNLPERPELQNIPDDVVAYIEALEMALLQRPKKQVVSRELAATAEPSEPPTSINVLTVSQGNLIKRTPRHHYSRQRRGGMGVFDLESPEDQPPSLLAMADENESLLLFSNFGRAFRLTLDELTESPVRHKGQPLATLLTLRPHERIVAALPADAGKYVVLLSQRGWVRRIRANYLGPNMIAGISFHDVKEGGYLVSACWTDGEGELFIATRDGKGIRFAESQVPGRGCLGLRVYVDDTAVAVTAVFADSGVFLAGNDGKGTIRLMAGFNANKAPGAGGKVALKTTNLVGAVTVTDQDDIFMISRLGKLIRFKAGEVPPKEGVVQGVNCMELRADDVTAVVASKNK